MGRGRVACPEDTWLVCHAITWKEYCIFLQHTIYTKFSLKSPFGIVMLTSFIEESLRNHTQFHEFLFISYLYSPWSHLNKFLFQTLSQGEYLIITIRIYFNLVLDYIPIHLLYINFLINFLYFL